MVCRVTFKDIFDDLSKQEGHKISIYGERTDLESVLYVLGKEHILTDVAIFDSKKKEGVNE